MLNRDCLRRIRRVSCALLLAAWVAAGGPARAGSIPLVVLDPGGSHSGENSAEATGTAALNDGFACLSRKDYDGAVEAFTRAIQSGYRPQVGYVQRATAFEGEKNHDQALADCDQATQIDPKFGLAFVVRGTINFTKRDFAHAVADESEAIRLNPGNTMAYYERGVNEDEVGDYDKAIADFNRVLDAADGNDAPAAGPVDDTSSRYGMILVESDGTKPNYYRGFAYLRKGDLARAEADFTAAIKADDKNVDAYSKRGMTRMREGQRDAALADFSNAIALAPQNAEIYNERAAALLGVHEEKAALDDLTTALKLNPRNASAHNNLGLALVRTGNPDAAIAEFTEALQIDPAMTVVYCNRANAYFAKGNLDAVTADLSQALALEPKNGALIANLALVYSKIGDYEKAVSSLEKAIDLGPGVAGPYNDLAWLLATCPNARFRDGKRALGYATTACNFSSWKDPVMLDTFAAACAEAGDFDAAVKWEQNAIAAPGLSASDLADAKKRLALYQMHKTYQDTPPPGAAPAGK